KRPLNPKDWAQEGGVMMRQIRWAALTVALFGLGIGQASAQFSENFDSGSATFTVNDPYWTTQPYNGYIVKDTTPTGFGNDIPQDVSGKGYFLFEGTGSYTLGNNNIPVGNDEFYISPTFSVTPNTNYNISFYLTDANGINNPSIQPEIGGGLLGSPVSPVGTY